MAHSEGAAAAGRRLSKKPIPSIDRLIVALDTPSMADATRLVTQLGDSVVFYKVGWEMLMSGDYFALVQWLKEHGKKVFVDLKFWDVPNTVGSAVKQLQRWSPEFATVHGNNRNIVKAALENRGSTKILAVTVLTSVDNADLDATGIDPAEREALGTDPATVQALVHLRAKRALELGCDGVIASGVEAPTLRDEFGDRFLIVAPGIRPPDAKQDDQKRVVDVEEAFLGGADYIVVGRPIRTAADPRATALSYRERIKRVFAG